MRTYFKYLIIGWTVITIILALYVFTTAIVEARYSVKLIANKEEVQELKNLCEAWIKLQEKQKARKERGEQGILVEDYIRGRSLERSIMEFPYNNPTEVLYVEEIEHHVPKEEKYLIGFVVTVFVIWAIPITVFSILGLFFTRKEHPSQSE